MKTKLPLKKYSQRNNDNFFKILIQALINLVKSNYLAYQLARRDITAQYRQSFLGLLWTLIIPLFTAVLWIFLKESSTVKLADTGMNYTLYVFAGTMAWAILTESILGPINSALGMRNTLSKINFPKEALITSSIYKTLFNTLVKLIILFFLVMFYKEPIGVNLLLFPFALLVILLFGTAIGTLITPIGLLYGDVGKLMNPFMQVVMYLSPVVFAMPNNQIGVYNKLINLNPLSSLINNFRNTILSQPLDHLPYYFSIFIISVLLFFIALVFYKITIPIITERISA